ncbi:hypothetical protein K491DRAFT_215876 [Lophiostoma macrostomum CBS 122681]|uniref:Secreted protein n=1 Tax=Lophiostoma macrostomum CBS 122681 TaxID=1314788 RepID=A0A6A6TJK1_9PLEO|nr:hypothetical protein K491DRAFT_215876 [Lophiostoma macrostomum CBS 122681]
MTCFFLRLACMIWRQLSFATVSTSSTFCLTCRGAKIGVPSRPASLRMITHLVQTTGPYYSRHSEMLRYQQDIAPAYSIVLQNVQLHTVAYDRSGSSERLAHCSALLRCLHIVLDIIYISQSSASKRNPLREREHAPRPIQ